MAKKKIIIISIVVLIVLITGLFYCFHPHSYALRESKEPTCTEAGYEIYRCWCGNEYRTEQKQTEHKYNSTVEEPTCTDAGKTIYKCEVCGDSYDEPIEAIGHNYEESTKEPTCTESGERVFKCKQCGDTYTEPIEALGHEYKDGVCVRCGEADHSAKPEQSEKKSEKTQSAQSKPETAQKKNVRGENNTSVDSDFEAVTGEEWAAAGWVELDPATVEAPVYDPYGLHFE